MGDDDFIVSKTDTKGSITYCNRIFVDMCSYSKSELIGANHNLIRHPDMPRVAFKLAWDLIQSGQEFFGFVKNLRKNGGYYWVFTYITADYDAYGRIIGYTSVRRKPNRAAVEAVIPIYKIHHIIYKSEAYTAVINTESDKELLEDHCGCSFGRWYGTFGKALFGDNPTFRKMHDYHESVHVNIRYIIENGPVVPKDKQLIVERFHKAEAASKELFALMDQLTEEVGSEVDLEKVQ